MPSRRSYQVGALFDPQNPEFAARCRAVAARIRAAFSEVSLDGGIGLREGNAIDDKEEEDVLAACRAMDASQEWSGISHADLWRFQCALSYVNAAGFRFLFPAYAVATLESGAEDQLIFHMTYPSNFASAAGANRKISPFSLFTDEQREAARAYLELQAMNRGESFHHGQIAAALDSPGCLK